MTENTPWRPRSQRRKPLTSDLDRKMWWMSNEVIGVIDYRLDDDKQIPDRCATCGAPIDRTEATGSVTLSGPADMAWAAKRGITRQGRYKTIWWEWRCSAQPAEHEAGPVHLAGA